jgi:hypothetical protein
VTLVILGTAALIGAFVALGLWIDRKFAVLPRPEALREAARPRLPGGDHAPGTAPQSALAVAPAEQPRVIEGQRCDCAGRPRLAAEGTDEVRYGERRLTAVRLRCGACGAGRALYFAPAS